MMALMPSTLVISTHYDDAVTSCGHWMYMNSHSEIFVSTVCSGFPGPGVVASRWDSDSYFVTADQAMAARQAEDLAALEVLGVRQGPFLGFLDGEYQTEGRTLAGLESAIDELLHSLQPDRCLVPLGVVHRDHIATGAACRRALALHSEIEPVVYADLLYKYYSVTAEGFSDAVEENAPVLEPIQWERPSTDQPKREAVRRYSSQLRKRDPLDPVAVEASLALDSEMFWRLKTPNE